jgi:hypothetical protein
MSPAEPSPANQALPGDKFRLMQQLIAEVPHEDGLAEGEYPVWSPYDAHEGAAALLKLLRQPA